MGHQSVVYGMIEAFHSSGDPALEVDKWNKETIGSLPETDDFPFLVREMFAVSASERVSIAYSYRVIHFGASYKMVESDWTEWLRKFESLLSRLYWVVASAHLHTDLVGSHDYEWLIEPSTMFEDRRAYPARWSFSGGPRHFEISGQ